MATVRNPCTSLPGPELHLHATFCPAWQIITAMETACGKCLDIHNSSIQFVSVFIMRTARPAALVGPPLGDGLQLCVPHLHSRDRVPGDSHSVCLVTILLMLAAPGWPRSSPLATRLLSSLCLARMLLLPSAVTPRVLVWLLHREEGPWGGARDIVTLTSL